MARMDSWLVEPQPRLGAAGLLVLLAMGSLVAPLSLDMYTPAVPGLAAVFGTTEDAVNLTLVGYYLFLAVGLLVFGPLSDKLGRKPVLVGGLAAYCASSSACALSPGIEALGSGAMSAVCTAVVKDAVREEHRERMLAIIQVMFVVGPVAAPIAGAGILAVVDWRATFWVLAAISAVELAMALLYRETLPPAKRLGTGVLRSLGRLGHVARNPGFTAFLLVTSAWEIGYMGYVSVGSYIYIDYFGFPPIGYSLFFAVAALTCAVGPVAWLRISRRVTKRRFTTIAIVASAAAGALAIAVGGAYQLHAHVHGRHRHVRGDGPRVRRLHRRRGLAHGRWHGARVHRLGCPAALVRAARWREVSDAATGLCDTPRRAVTLS